MPDAAKMRRRIAQRNMEHAQSVARKEIVKQQQAAAAERKAKEREAALTKLKEERRQAQEILDADANASIRHYQDLAEEQRLLASLEACHSNSRRTSSWRVSAGHPPRARSRE